MRSLDLLRRVDSLAERARSIATMVDADRRRFAAEAVAERDADALWWICLAYATRRKGRSKTLSPRTLASYERGVRELLVMWQGENLLRPHPDAAANYREDLREGNIEPLLAHGPIAVGGRAPAPSGRSRSRSGLSDASIKIKLVAGKLLYDALAWTDLFAGENPFEDVGVGGVRNRVEASLEDAHYAEDELRALYGAVEGVDDQLVLLLGSHAGLRVSEMLALTWQDVRSGRAELLVRSGKGGKDAAVVASDALVALLVAVRRMRGPAPSDPVVSAWRSASGVYKRLRALCEAAGVPFKGVHALRHSAGTRLLRDTGRIDLVQELLRHETLDMARAYARSDKTALREAVKDWKPA
jgi:integrase/recombinase XerC